MNYCSFREIYLRAMRKTNRRHVNKTKVQRLLKLITALLCSEGMHSREYTLKIHALFQSSILHVRVNRSK